MKFMPLLSLFTTVLAAPGKRGLAYPWDAKYDISQFGTGSGQVSWIYNWEHWMPAKIPSTMKANYVAMARTAKEGPTLAEGVRVSGARTVFCLNEPDEPGQANMSVENAVKFWKQYCEPLAKAGKSIIAPAITNGGGEMGFNYLEKFLKQCTGCTVDGLNWHWYGGSLDQFKQHIESGMKRFPNFKIWVTEFALQSANTPEFLKGAMTYLDGVSRIRNYAVFGAFESTQQSNAAFKKNALITNGKLNEQGRLYRNQVSS